MEKLLDEKSEVNAFIAKDEVDLSNQSESASSLDKNPVSRRLRSCNFVYGFWPCAIYLLLCALTIAALNIFWAGNGTLGFDSVSGIDVVSGSIWLLDFRIAAVAASLIGIVCPVLRSRRRAQVAGGSLGVGGLDILPTCTFWTWVLKASYFIVVCFLTVQYQLTGFVPSALIAKILWVWFEIAYGMAWLVFVACWFALLPAAYLSGSTLGVQILLSGMCLYLHNVNLLLMFFELVLSRWHVVTEHFIFCLYFGMVYIVFNWWWKSKTGTWKYFFLSYEIPTAIPNFFMLKVSIFAFFCFGAWIGQRLA